ncbi:MAG: hypothetical protein JOZ81_30765, partial [Chloroflexi bacterium]|nr:hypothetical protein [Chloroflexota bacterium]
MSVQDAFRLAPDCPDREPGAGTDARRVRVAVAMGVAVLACLLPAVGTVARAESGGIKVSGNTLVDGHGNPVRLLGVNRSGAEFACVG